MTDVQTHLAAVKIQGSELGKLQEKQRAAVQRSIGRNGQLLNGKERAPNDSDEEYPRRRSSVHPDLQDLNFGGPLGSDQRYVPRTPSTYAGAGSLTHSRDLPPPMRPSAPHSHSDDYAGRRGSLSDFSDYESSDEETHNRVSGSGSGSHAQAYGGGASDDESADPFADPQDEDDEDENPQHKTHW